MKERQLRTKIDFLNQEVQFSQKETKQFRTLLKLNKDIIQALMKEQNCQKVFNLLYNENTFLTTLNETLSIQRDEAICKSQVNEQIAEDAIHREKQIIQKSQGNDFNTSENTLPLSSSQIQLLLFQQIEYSKVQLAQDLKENQSLQKENYKFTPDESFEDLPIKVVPKFQPKNGIPIPKLDLTKAQKIQRINVKKQEEQEEQEQQKKAQTPVGSNTYTMFTSQNKLQQNLLMVSEQFRSVQRELHQFKLKLEEEMLSQKNYQDELTFVRSEINEEYEINELLIKQQEQYVQKWHKVANLNKQLDRFCLMSKKQLSSLTSSFKSEQKAESLLDFEIPELKIQQSIEKMQMKEKLMELAYGLYQKKRQQKDELSQSVILMRVKQEKIKRCNSK